jgi:Bacterial Ig domain/Immunoglobulin I-set domain
MTPARRYLPALATLLFAFLVLSFLPPVALATCTAPKNAIEAENCLPGTPPSQWYVSGAGSPNIQGFTTDISVNAGETIFFKVSTNAASYRIDIYRLGYYQGKDARFVTSISPSVQLPQIQHPCLTESATGLVDCGNWAISASWTVPSTAMSGVYFAKLVRLDNGEASPLIFVVRNDSSHSDILVQTSDPTWQAYNTYGGNSLYSGSPAGRAYKVSYNRPVNTLTSFFAAEYNLHHWLEANGYDVTYSTGVDTDRNGALITQHKVFMSVGHDEYWSAGQRSNVEAARAAGVHLAFFSGDEVSWKTRWEPSIDGANALYRTLVCYKERDNGAIDSADPPTWTGRWRDPRFSPPADGGRPGNALTGTIFEVLHRSDPIIVPQADGRMRFWRNTGMALLGPGQVGSLPAGVLGYEWDIDADNGFRPAGLIRLSTTTESVSGYLYFSPSAGYYFGSATATHHLTLYRAPSGALVFGAGTIHWSQGVENDNGGFSGSLADPNAKQATVNLLADMGVQPATLQSGLTPATASTDATPPTSAITSPPSGTKVTVGSSVTISGTAVDSGGGVVGGVEVSVDGGTTWHPATGRENWSYVFTAGNAGTLNVQSRAVDDSGNLEVPSPGITVTVNPASGTTPPTVSKQPGNQTVTAGQTATFTAAATGSPTPTVQWQVSTNGGGTFSSLPGATSTTLSFATDSSQNGNQYRAVFTNSAGSATTTAATLTVNPATTKVPIQYEPEKLLSSSVSSGPTYRAFAWTGFTDGNGTILDATKVGDNVTITLNVPQAGTYDVKVAVKMFASRGSMQLSVNGTNVGPAKDQYVSSSAWAEFDLGNVTVSSAGNQSFKFTVVGKNSASSGYSISFDYIKLTPQ